MSRSVLEKNEGTNELSISSLQWCFAIDDIHVEGLNYIILCKLSRFVSNCNLLKTVVDKTTHYSATKLITSNTMCVTTGVCYALHICVAGEIRDAGERRLFGALERSSSLLRPIYVALGKWALKSAAHIWDAGEMSVENRDAYMWNWATMS